MELSRPVERARALPVVVPDRVVLDALTALAAADQRLEVAQASLPALLDVPGVRAAAVVERSDTDVVVQGSAGYDCGELAPGARLRADAGLPVTEAVRTGRTVVRGTGPSWVAAPFRRPAAGALLLSLTGAPPEDVGPVVLLARAVGQALVRVRRAERALADLAVLTAAAGPDAVDAPSPDVALRSRPLEGPGGGDVLLALPDGRGGRWLLVADVCGTGLRAALVARSVTTAVRALAPHARGPADLLSELDRSLRPGVAPGSFVTALVVHQGSRAILAASAGHPPPLLRTPSAVVALDLPTGLPLGLETGPDDGYRAVAVDLPPQALLVLHTDGLGDRAGARGTEPLALLAEVPHADPATVADGLLAAADRVGAATDDVALMAARAFPTEVAG